MISSISSTIAPRTPSRKNLYLQIAAATVFINLLVLALPLFTMNVYDRVLPVFDAPTLFVLTTGIMVALVFDVILKVIRGLYFNILATSLSTQEEADILDGLLTSPHAISLSAGKQMTIFRDLAAARGFWVGRLVPFCFDAPFALVFIGVIALISPQLAWVPLVGAVAIIAVGVALLKIGRIGQDTNDQQHLKKPLLLLDLIQGGHIIRAFNATQDKLNQWRSTAAQDIAAQKSDQFLNTIMAHYTSFIGLSVSVFVLFFGAYQVDAQSLSFGGLIAVSILSSRTLAPLSGLSTVFAGYRQYCSHRDNAAEMQRTVNAHRAAAPALHDKTDLTPSITLDSVDFAYHDTQKNGLKALSLAIPAGGKYGIIGKSGAGKTTLINLMAGNIAPQQGNIFWGGYHIHAVPQEQRARTLGLASQSDHIFAGTLADNIFLGCNAALKDDPAHKDAIAHAIFLSGLDFLMKETGFGWDTPITEGGTNLSNGAKQSICLARTFVKNPQILILDEPMRGLDYAIEKRLMDHLPAWIADKTFIMITHKTTLLPLVDHVVLMDAGAVKAHGTRDDVIKALNNG